MNPATISPHHAYSKDMQHALGVLLSWSASSGDADSIRRLIERGADPEGIPSSDGMTPLHRAADLGRTEACLVLIEAGADHRALDSLGRTPVDLAKGETRSVLLRLISEKERGDLEACSADPATSTPRRRI